MMYRYQKLFSTMAAVICAMLLIVSPASVTADVPLPEAEAPADVKATDAELEKELRWLQEEAEAVFVTVATKTRMTAKEAPSVVSVITGEEIRNMGARNLADVLRTVPGFDVTHKVTFPSHITRIRGSGDYDSVKVMINGHAPKYIREYYDMFPVSSIRRIEIIRGPGSALYGAGAFFGIINIITGQGGEEPSRVSLEGGSYATVKPSAEFSYKDKEFRVWLYADHQTTDGYDGIIESDMTDSSQWLRGNTPGEMTGDGKYYNLLTNISHKNFYLTGMLNADDRNNPVGITKALTDENEIKNICYFGEIGYKGALDEKGNLTFRMFYERLEMDRFSEVFPEETAEMEMHSGFPPGEGLNGNPMFKKHSFGGEVQADYEFARGVQLVGGAHYEYMEDFDVKIFANYNGTGSPLEIDEIIYPAFPYKYLHTGWTDRSESANWLDESDRTVLAFYAQGVFDLKELFSLTTGAENLSFTAGIRHDDYDDIGQSTNPRFGIVYAPTEKLWFKALYGTAFRAPTSIELYVKNNPAWTGNRELKPEELETVECLVGYKFAKNISASLTYYHVDTDNLIIFRDREERNEGKGESSGIEAEMRMDFGRHRYAYLNLTWQDVRNTTHSTITSAGGQTYIQDDFNPGGIPEIMGNIGVNYDFFDEHVIANISLNYVGERERSEEKKWVGETLARSDQREPTKDRTLVNASLTFRNFYKGLEAQVSCFNIFNADHRDPDDALYYDMPEPGRWFTGRISYLF